MSTVQDNCAATQPQLNASTVEYRDIPGYPGYRAGNDGTIWTQWIQRPNKGRGSVSYIGDKWRPLTRTTHHKGYLVVAIKQDGKVKQRSVHRLVLLTFVGPCPEGMESCHNDGDRGNPRLKNLRWDTPKGNASDKYRHGTALQGSSSPNAKLTEDDVRWMIEQSKTKRPCEIGKPFGLKSRHVINILKRRHWAHVVASEDYSESAKRWTLNSLSEYLTAAKSIAVIRTSGSHYLARSQDMSHQKRFRNLATIAEFYGCGKHRPNLDGGVKQ